MHGAPFISSPPLLELLLVELVLLLVALLLALLVDELEAPPPEDDEDPVDEDVDEEAPELLEAPPAPLEVELLEAPPAPLEELAPSAARRGSRMSQSWLQAAATSTKLATQAPPSASPFPRDGLGLIAPERNRSPASLRRGAN